ncbi:MAG TPA: carboxypeptidase-like regulatory domain-containing protein [Thermoanaerobaculia bacterium]
MTRATLAVLMLLLAAVQARGEVCRFPAPDPENPFLRWLASQEVTCVPDAAQVAFPEGSWNVFVRREGTVSAKPMLIEGGGAPASVAAELVPAATVIPLLPEGHSGVLYAPRRGSAFPVDAARVTVPADEPLWLFVLDRTTPAAVIPMAPLAAGTERQVDGRRGGPFAIVGWLQMPEADRDAVRWGRTGNPVCPDRPDCLSSTGPESGVSSPVVRAGSRDAEPLPPPSLLHGAFFLLRDVAPGNAELRLEGRGWLPSQRAVKVQPGITVAAAPLLVRAAGTLVVNWNTDEDFAALDRYVGACQEDETPPKIVIVVSKCPAPRGNPRFNTECTPIREETVETFAGSRAFEDVVPGLYRAEMRYGKLPPAGGMTNVAPLRVAELRVFASYHTVYGSVTRDGEPLGEEVRIGFPGGIGFAPAESEEYRAVFSEFLDVDSRVEIVACDGAPRSVVLTDKPIRPRARFDLDIPGNELTVQVTDTFTREPLPGATVKLEAMGLRGRAHAVFTTTKSADEQGSLTWSGVPIRELHLTITHPGYEKREIEPFTMETRGAKSVDAQLVPLRGTRGKVVSDRPFENAIAWWFSAAGTETERTDVAPDGTFVYANRHTSDETLAIVSSSHPLWVLRSPATEGRDSISIAFPNVPAVAFDVWLSASVPPTMSRYVGVIIGGIRVPHPVLAQHQNRRDLPPLLRGSGPQSFRDLLGAGPIDVLLGPTIEEVATRARSMDLFALPQFANAPRKRLEPGTSDVVFSAIP